MPAFAARYAPGMGAGSPFATAATGGAAAATPATTGANGVSSVRRASDAPYLAGPGAASEAARRLQQNRASTATTATSSVAANAQAALQPEPTDFAREPKRQESAHWITRTALCVEVRDPRRANGPKAEAVGKKSGVLYVFMPPLELLEDYLDLLAAIEATATELKVKIVLEGYPPPRDPRFEAAAGHTRPRRD